MRHRSTGIRTVVLGLACTSLAAQHSAASLTDDRPNIILVMADDMGWGQTGYYNHPVLKTPHLDAMAANGLRFDRFYAGAPNCSPTRATVMTGRSNDRTGVQNHGFPLCLQEKTVAQALRDAGFATGHFGKWHLNGLRGPGVPVLADDARSPGVFGFDTWLSVTNFFDRNPVMSRMGKFEEFEGDSSEIIVAEALKFITAQTVAGRPSFTVIWYGSPHSPFVASDEDTSGFDQLNDASGHHYGELVAMDRSIGTLRQGLRDLKIADETLLWFCSDNGGLPNITPETVGELRGFKNSVYEGGLRVPAIIEWPRGIPNPRVTAFPSCTMDIFPTLAEIADLPASASLAILDGVSLTDVFKSEPTSRAKPIPFRHTNRGALIDNDFKLVTPKVGSGNYQLYNLSVDPKETNNLYAAEPERALQMTAAFEAWNESLEASARGMDYPEQKISPPQPGPESWKDVEAYRPYFEAWTSRPEYKSWLSPPAKSQRQ